MNRIYKSILAVALLIMVAGSANAQKRCIMGDETHRKTYEVSDNMVVRKISDNQVVATPKLEKNIVKTEGKGTGVLQINGFGNYFMMMIVNEEGYRNFAFPGMEFSEEVTEGRYYVYAEGTDDADMFAICVYDVVVSSGNGTTILNVDMADAQNVIRVIGKNENGNSFADLPINNYTYSIDNIIVIGDNYFSTQTGMDFETYDESPFFKINDFGDYCKIYTTVSFTTENQECYLINYPTIAGMSGDVTIENDNSTFARHEEYFNINNQEGPSYYGVCCFTYAGNIKTRANGVSEICVFDQSKPYTIVTNAVDDGSPVSYDQAKIRITPTIYNSYDWNSWAWPPYEDVMCPFGIGLGSDGRFFYEPYGNFYDSYTGYNVASFPNLLAETPAKQYLDEMMYYGSRTPLLYQNSYNLNAAASMSSMAFIQCKTSYLGENGLQRVGDQWQPISVTLNGNTIWNDTLFFFNQNRTELEEAGIVEMNITNNNITNSCVEKTNTTNIRFDLSGDDAMPPTFTMLQVLDQDGKENVTITNLDFAEINVAAGDWRMYEDPVTWDFYPIYVEGVEIELYYKTAVNPDFKPLEFTEVEDMFHINYGKYFNVKLSQLEGVDEKWVSMKLVVTDAAGNSQEQILENLFYVDIAWSVAETNTLAHSVYPNPFTNEVRINAAEAVNGNASISVFNVLGEQVISKAMNCNETTEFVIDGSNLNVGIYFYNVATENGTLKGRIVKE